MNGVIIVWLYKSDAGSIISYRLSGENYIFRCPSNHQCASTTAEYFVRKVEEKCEYISCEIMK
jgi:hypothetical protein